ncbi:hypothetical protein Tco_0828415 [Tanacetum coccineum]
MTHSLCPHLNMCPEAHVARSNAQQLRYYAAKDIRFGVDARALILVFAPTCKDDEILYMSLSLPVSFSNCSLSKSHRL